MGTRLRHRSTAATLAVIRCPIAREMPGKIRPREETELSPARGPARGIGADLLPAIVPHLVQEIRVQIAGPEAAGIVLAIREFPLAAAVRRVAPWVVRRADRAAAQPEPVAVAVPPAWGVVVVVVEAAAVVVVGGGGKQP